MAIAPGDHLMARTAKGQMVPRRAVSGITEGETFLVVWVCDEGEYDRAASEGREPAAVPWPANAVEKRLDS